MYLTLDSLADGGVWAGIPKDLSLRLIAHTMMVRQSYKNIYYSYCCLSYAYQFLPYLGLSKDVN